jgi:hypothetical protein
MLWWGVEDGLRVATWIRVFLNHFSLAPSYPAILAKKRFVDETHDRYVHKVRDMNHL